MAIQISTDVFLMTWIYSTSAAPTRDRSTEDFSLLNVLHSDPTSITLGGRKGRRRRKEEGGEGRRKGELIDLQYMQPFKLLLRTSEQLQCQFMLTSGYMIRSAFRFRV